MNTCKSLRALFGDARIWSDVVFDSRGSFVKFDVFKLFLRRLPEGSIRKLTIDSNLIEPAKVSDLMEILMHTKQWRITSIHAVGKKLNSTMLTKIVKGLWSEDIKVLSIHDVIVSKMDVVTAAKCCLNMTGLNKIRMEGDVHLLALKTLAGQRPDSGGIAGNNSITHLSFCVRSALTWDNIIHASRLRSVNGV